MNIEQQFLQNHYEIISLKKSIVEFPPGSLKPYSHQNRHYFSYNFFRGGKRHRYHISQQDADILADAIHRRQYLEQKLKQLEQHEEALEAELKKQHTNPLTLLIEDHNSKLHQLYQQQENQFNRMVAANENGNRPLIMTNDGIYVKSKSEAMISNQLSINNLKYYYEKPLALKDRTVKPDFTIEYNGRTIYWEHCGCTHDPEYMNNWWKKYQAYIDAGYLVGRDLIITYEYEGFSSQFIQSVISLQILQAA